ncbi:MAG: hypothetical protein NTV80_27025 [Verrucomicrobia bacterium]|nr:hypothetical protein [Verrucomicrobiota bacterium]
MVVGPLRVVVGTPGAPINHPWGFGFESFWAKRRTPIGQTQTPNILPSTVNHYVDSGFADPDMEALRQRMKAALLKGAARPS